MALAQLHNGKLHHLHTDHLGTPLEATNEEGEITWKVTYRTWGNTVVEEVTEIQPKLRFQGQYFDSETGLHYNRFRYYDPAVGRFVSQDPIGIHGGFNLFQYAPNPTKWVDPFGLTGTYIFTDGTTSYIGKGPKNRMRTSMTKRIGKPCNATVELHMDFGDNKMGFMVEHLLMEEYNARESSDFANSNKRNSPGKKIYEKATDKEKAEARKNFEKMHKEYEDRKSKASCSN